MTAEFENVSQLVGHFSFNCTEEDIDNGTCVYMQEISGSQKLTTIILLTIYGTTLIVGVPANLYVLFRMRKLASSDNERYRNGTGVALCSMAAADLCSILLILSQNIPPYLKSIDVMQPERSISLNIMCKMMLFLTHTATGISIWSWLLLSSLRYLAICHPLYHLRLWQMPYRALAFIISTSLLLNAWLLFSIQYQPEHASCDQVPLIKNSIVLNRLLSLIEYLWSFSIPCAVIIMMDTSVVLKSTSFPRFRLFRKRKSALEEVIKLTRTSSDRLRNIQRRHQKALFKWLLVALVCIILNTPENLFRFLVMLDIIDLDPGDFVIAFRAIAQAFYFSQFAFNAIYLAVFVYDKSSRSRIALEISNHNSHAVTLTHRSRRGSSDVFSSPRPVIHVFPPSPLPSPLDEVATTKLI